MKIFIPSILKGTYLNEIDCFTKSEFHFDNFQNFDPSFEIVNIHWPEAIFNWKEPSDEEIELLEREIRVWKKSATLVYTKHDSERVKGWTRNFKKLFEIIERESDVFVHLGNHSQRYYAEKFPNKKHTIIPHPTFENSFEIIDKRIAREKLGIDKNSLVITAAGQIRSKEEKGLLLKTFKKIKSKNKVLICTNMRNELEWNFPGRVKLKKVFDIKSYIKEKFESKYQPPQYLFTYTPQDNYKFSLQISAADVIFIPRIDLLNTGNVLLGLTFKKVTVGPAIGNIKEQLEDHNLPAFNPNSISSAVAGLNTGIELYNSGIKPGVKEKYLARNVAREYDNLFEELIINEF